MKKKHINTLIAASTALALIACTRESVIDDLQGIYTAPVVEEMTTLVSSAADKADGKRIFTINLKSENAEMSASLVGNNYFLSPNTYSPANEAAAKNGNYLLGKTKIGGKNVASGSLIVSKSGDAKAYSPDDVYTFDGMFFCEDGTPYRVKWSGNLAYEEDKEAIRLVKVLSAQSNLANGIATLSMQLATEDISSAYDPATYSTTYSGEGYYLALDIYSADGYLHEGTYKPCSVGGSVGEGEYGIGYDTQMWGMTFTNWGTCWWTVSNGSTSAEKILTGDIIVKQEGGNWVISVNNDITWTEFNGAIPALTGTRLSLQESE